MPLDPIQEQERFDAWLEEMAPALRRFIERFPEDVRPQLDFSLSSLDVVEQWLLDRYASPQEILADGEEFVLDGAARYVGETIRRNLGGRWDLRLDKPNVFYGLPQIDFGDGKTPEAPLTLVTAALDRRTETYIRGVVEGLRRLVDRD